MKILYHHRIASKDGQYVHVSEIINALRALGHEVLVVEPGATTEREFGESASLVSKLRRLLPGFVHELAEFFYSVVDYQKLNRAIQQFQPDVIYERYNLFFPSGIWAAKRHQLPLILEVNAPLFQERSKHGGLSLSALARWSENYVWRSADKVLPVTEVLASKVADVGVEPERLSVIANGVNRQEFAQAIDGEAMKSQLGIADKKVLGFTGFVRDWHKLDRVIDLLSDPRLDQWHLLIVGDGPVCVELKQQAERLRVADRVTFAGIVPREKVRGFISTFDVALQPDAVEYASPLKLFEYLAMGKAVVAPNKPNICEVLTNDENALLFDPDDESNFAEKVLETCDSSELRERLGAGAKELIESMGYYWDRNAERIVSYAEALAETADQGVASRE